MEGDVRNVKKNFTLLNNILKEKKQIWEEMNERAEVRQGSHDRPSQLRRWRLSYGSRQGKKSQMTLHRTVEESARAEWLTGVARRSSLR